jgi:hypothetical protein
MRHKWFAVVFALSPLVASGSWQPDLKEQLPPIPDGISGSRPVAFVDVTVIPMTFNGVLEHQTVVTMHGQIHSIGAVDEVEMPDASVVIDGAGRFLMPGLADMHTHLDIELGDGANEAVLWLANGVTTIFNLGDQITPLGEGLMGLRDSILRGRLPGPTIYTASIAYGPATGAHASHTFTTAQQGRDFVIASKAAGYDFMKVYTSTTAATFGGISQQAGIEGMPIIGHIPTEVGLNEALRGGMRMVTHLNEFWCRTFDCGMNSDRLDAAVNPLVRRGGWVATTLALNENLKDMYCGDLTAFERFLDRPHMRFVNPEIIAWWRNLVTGSWNPSGCHRDDIEGPWDFTLWYTKEFFDAGIPMVLGTDSPPVMGAPGWSLHEEMRIMKTLLTEFEVLILATVNAGRFMEENLSGVERFGTIEVGSRADLLLLEANPLDDITNAKRRVGVMARGRWYSERDLQRRLEQVAYSYHGPPEPLQPSGRRAP